MTREYKYFMQRSKTRLLVLCALFAALTAVLSQVIIPIGLIPINLATFAVFCAGALLGSKLGALSLALWVAIGAVGMPVFTMFRGGFGALLGPTGGYIVGYVPAAFIIGMIIENAETFTSKKVILYPAAMLVGMLNYFILGTVWFMYSTSTGLWEALMICVIPFLPGEAIKIACATLVAIRVRPLLYLT